jgi:hypothetical protein
VVDGHRKLVRHDSLGLGEAMSALQLFIGSLHDRGRELAMNDDLRESPIEMGISDFAVSCTR